MTMLASTFHSEMMQNKHFDSAHAAIAPILLLADYTDTAASSTSSSNAAYHEVVEECSYSTVALTRKRHCAITYACSLYNVANVAAFHA
jgi:hypothetical protein